MSGTLRPRRVGLIASRLHREGPDVALVQLVRRFERAITDELALELFVVGRTHAALATNRLLEGYAGLHALPDRRDGGLMRLTAMLVDDDPARTLDAVIYLLDPEDPTSVFPEGQALKRQSVVHGKPFISTFAHAREWLELERVLAGFAPDPTLDELFDPANEAIALVAHDARRMRWWHSRASILNCCPDLACASPPAPRAAASKRSRMSWAPPIPGSMR